MKYFEKTSKEKKKSYKGRNILVGAGGVTIAALANPEEQIGVIPRKMSAKIMKSTKEIKDPRLMEAALKKAKELKVKVDIRKKFAPIGVYEADSRLVIVGKNRPATLFHELGHSVNFKKFQSLPKLRVGGLKVAPLATLAAAVSKKDSTISKVAPYAAAAAIAPTLADEATASIRAIKDLKKVKATKTQLSLARKNLGKGFATYAIPMAAMVAVPALIRKFKK